MGGRPLNNNEGVRGDVPIILLDVRRASGPKDPGGKIMAVVCPECDNPIVVDVDEVEEGETVQCEECGIDLEVVSVDPLELAAVDDAGYDDEDVTHAGDEEEE
jgi:alpha-aminoadipate carrier protein LysW